VHLIAQFGNPFQIAWNMLTGLLAVYAVVCVARVPATAYTRGWRSKAFWLVASVGFVAAFAGYVLPIGAVWAIRAVTTQPPRRRHATEVEASASTAV